MLHTMKLQPHSFDKIKEGSKTIEVRLFDKKRQGLKIGDIIEFRCEPERKEVVQTEIVGLLNYKTFLDLVNDVPASDFGDKNKKLLLEKIYAF